MPVRITTKSVEHDLCARYQYGGDAKNPTGEYNTAVELRGGTKLEPRHRSIKYCRGLVVGD